MRYQCSEGSFYVCIDPDDDNLPVYQDGMRPMPPELLIRVSYTRDRIYKAIYSLYFYSAIYEKPHMPADDAVYYKLSIALCDKLCSGFGTALPRPRQYASCGNHWCPWSLDTAHKL